MSGVWDRGDRDAMIRPRRDDDARGWIKTMLLLMLFLVVPSAIVRALLKMAGCWPDSR